MSRDVNKDVCQDVGCPDNDPLRDIAHTRHHHTKVAAGVLPDQKYLFSETHGGRMFGCSVRECQFVWANTATTPVQDERITGVQEDLVTQAADIAEWWVNTAKADAEATAPKAVEYGAADFEVMGQMIVALIKDKFVGADDGELMKIGREMACMFYLQGKIGRALGAYQQGMMPSDDTVFDIGVYSMMWRRIRQTGQWVK